jgi:hypothetical protein
VYRTDSQLVEDYASEMLFAGCPQHPSVAYGAAMDSFFVDPTAFRAKQEFSGGWAGDIDTEAEPQTVLLSQTDRQLVASYAAEIVAVSEVPQLVAYGSAMESFLADPCTFRAMLVGRPDYRGQTVLSAHLFNLSVPLTACPPAAAVTVGYTHDKRMEQHFNVDPYSGFEEDHPERPERHAVIVEQMRVSGTADRCLYVPARKATEAELRCLHRPKYIARVKASAGAAQSECHALAERCSAKVRAPLPERR